MQVTSTWDGVRGVITLTSQSPEVQRQARMMASFPRLTQLVQRIVQQLFYVMDAEITDLTENHGFHGGVQLHGRCTAPPVDLLGQSPADVAGFIATATVDLVILPVPNVILQCIFTVTPITPQFTNQANFLRLYIQPDIAKALRAMLEKIFARLEEIMAASRFAYLGYAGGVPRGENSRVQMVADIYAREALLDFRPRLYQIADATFQPRYTGQDSRAITEILILGLVNPQVDL